MTAADFGALGVILIVVAILVETAVLSSILRRLGRVERALRLEIEPEETK